MKYREIARKLRDLGCEEISRHSGGSHRKWYNPATNAISPIPDWGSKDLQLGTVRAIVHQLGLEWDRFNQA